MKPTRWANKNSLRLIELFLSTEIFSKRRKIYAFEGKPELTKTRHFGANKCCAKQEHAVYFQARRQYDLENLHELTLKGGK